MMQKREFCHLHNHTEYSLLDGGARIPDLVARAKDLGMDALAITDHGVMYGAIQFYRECLEHDIKPILGCEVYMAPGSRLEHTRGQQDYNHLLLLAETNEGYSNLVRIVTDAHLNGFYYKPRADFQLLAQHSEGIIAATACLQGAVPQRLLGDDHQGAEQYVRQLQEIFGDDSVYIEIQDHGIEEQQQVNPQLQKMSADLGAPLLASNDLHYVSREDADLHDVLLCIGTDSALDDENRMRFSSDNFYLKSQEEMADLFSHCPEALVNTVEVAERCNVELELDSLNLPHFPIPEGHTAQTYLREKCENAIVDRYGELRNDVQKRLDHELDIIQQTQYSGYFLIVGDFIREAKERGILVGPGRGSAAGSIVSYLLGISEIDPLEQDLIFERMLNPERVSPPDIDLDFPDDRREDIIEYVKDRYGEDRCAQVVTFSRLGAKAAVRDVGRVMGIEQDRINQLAKAIPEGADLGEALEQAPELQQLVQGDQQLSQLMEYALGLEGQTRHCSVHAAAVVISNQPITDIVPLSASKGTVTTQYPMDDVEACGMVKMDFLGLKTLTIIRRTIDMVRENHGVEIDILNIPRDDPATFELLQRGDTMAVFQLESDGMQNLLRQLKPDSFDHVVPLVALYRPGPMESIPDFCHGRHGGEVSYLHPKLEPILEETFGVLLYQEQVMQVAAELAGFSMPQAEIIMRAMSKKQVDKMQKMKPLFIEGCVKNGVEENIARELFQRMETFAEYAFNKSHAAAYGLVAYWTAYLKANYTAELLAAQLSTVMDSTDDIAKYMSECRRMDVQVQPPSINRSDVTFSVKDGAVVFGLAAIKGFGVTSAQAIVNERRENGEYAGINDLCRRLSSSDLTKSQLKTLVQAGALDEFGERNALQFIHEQAHASGQKYQEDQRIGQNSLFEAVEDDQIVHDDLPDVEPLDPDKKLELEKEFLGLYVSDHPLLRVEQRIEECCTCRLEDIEDYPDDTRVRIGGVVGEMKPYNSQGGMMMFMTLEGIADRIDVTIFPRSYQKCKDNIIRGEVVLVDGKIQRRSQNGGDGPEEAGILADNVRPLQGARALSEKRQREAQKAKQQHQRTRELKENPPEAPAAHIDIDCALMNGSTLPKLREILQQCEGIQPVILRLHQNGICRRVKLGNSYRVTCDQILSSRSRTIPGVTSVW